MQVAADWCCIVMSLGWEWIALRLVGALASSVLSGCSVVVGIGSVACQSVFFFLRCLCVRLFVNITV